MFSFGGTEESEKSTTSNLEVSDSKVENPDEDNENINTKPDYPENEIIPDKHIITDDESKQIEINKLKEKINNLMENANTKEGEEKQKILNEIDTLNEKIERIKNFKIDETAGGKKRRTRRNKKSKKARKSKKAKKAKKAKKSKKARKSKRRN